MMGLSDGEKTLRIRVIVYTQYRRVTDGRTDILPRHSPRNAYASRGKKPQANGNATKRMSIMQTGRDVLCFALLF